MDTQTLPLVPFGKYKGKPITTLLADARYLEWCKQQEWFKNKCPIVYNICVNQTIPTNNQNSKTPEHNKLQNMFLDKSNQHKLLSQLFIPKHYKVNLSRINDLFANKDIRRCFGMNVIPEFINKLDRTTIKFEDKFNWDFVLYYSDLQNFKITSNLETELIDKEKYKKQYDIEQTQIHLDTLQKHDEKINIREVLDKELKEEFEANFSNYIEQKHNNQSEVNNYENELQNYIKIKSEYEFKTFKELCVTYKINVCFDRNNMENKFLEKQNSRSMYRDYVISSYLDKNELLSEKEKNIYRIRIRDELDIIMKEWENDNISLIPKEIKKINIPEPFDINKCIYINPSSKHADLFYNYIDNVDNLKRKKERYLNEYKKDYEKHFNKHYEKYRLQYYIDIIKEYCCDKWGVTYKENQISYTYHDRSYLEYEIIIDNSLFIYLNIINKNQYEIRIDICDFNYTVCCELKPTLSDDYPVVLRKMKTQIELTQNDKKFGNVLHDDYKKKYILIIGSFSAISCSKEELISIFKQSNIKIIFTDEIFETSNASAAKAKTTQRCVTDFFKKPAPVAVIKKFKTQEEAKNTT